jgi:hypothetical protein
MCPSEERREENEEVRVHSLALVISLPTRQLRAEPLALTRIGKPKSPMPGSSARMPTRTPSALERGRVQSMTRVALVLTSSHV